MLKRCLIALLVLASASCVGYEPEADEAANDLVVYETAQTVGPIGCDPDVWGPDPAASWTWPWRAMQLSAPTTQAVATYQAVIPYDAEVTQVSTMITPAFGHPAVPMAQPSLFVVKVNELQGLASVVGTVGMGAMFLADYEQDTTLLLETTIKIKNGDQLFMHVLGESGKEFLPGLIVQAPVVQYTP